MKYSVFAVLSLATCASGFTSSTVTPRNGSTKLEASLDRRDFGNMVWGAALSTAASGLVTSPQSANAQVFFDPAQYGDQELRVSAVDSLKESVRRAILQNPKLAPSFYQLSLLDSLSFNADTREYGPDASVIKVVLSAKGTDEYTANLQKAALALVDAEKTLRRKTAITLADAVAIAGAEAVESIGGPVLPVQLGRADAPLQAPVSSIPLDLFTGKYSSTEVTKYFLQAGVTEREMTALLSALLTIENVEKSRTTDDWKQSAKPKFREAGKMGRMSEFKRLTDDDIAEAEAQAALEADPDYEDPDDGWYISDSFGTRESRFGQRIGADEINEKTFNKYLKDISEQAKKKKDLSSYGWIATMLNDPAVPQCQTWLVKYSGSNLNYIKDLSASFNAVTQLGAVYTGGKYENLLKNKPRKSLNNDDLNLF